MADQKFIPGSATGFDLSALEQLARDAGGDTWTVEERCGDRGYLIRCIYDANQDQVVGEVGLSHCEAQFIAAANPATMLALIALARATPQHPDDLSNAEFLSKRLARVAKLAGVTMPDGTHEQIAGVAGTILGDIARHLEKAATPQHSVTGQSDEAVTLLAAVFDAWENGDPCYEDPETSGGFLGMAFRLDDDVFKRCCDLLNLANPPRNAQPLASTAATQPEQASIKTWQERALADGFDVSDRRAFAPERQSMYQQAEIADLRAALAIPASTAASEQQASVSERTSFEKWHRRKFPDAEFGLVAGAYLVTSATPRPHGSFAVNERWKAWQAALSGRATIPSEADERAVGEIVANDPVHGWHMNPLVPWDQIGAGTKLYTHRATTATPCGWLAGNASDGGEMMYYRREAAQRECDQHDDYERSRPDFDADNLRTPEPVFRAAAPDTATTAADGMSSMTRAQHQADRNECFRLGKIEGRDTATTAADQQGDTASVPLNDADELARYKVWIDANPAEALQMIRIAQQGDTAGASFADWLAREMPAGTVIGDPAWWALRILRAAQQGAAQAPPVAYADPQAFRNFEAGAATNEWMWAKPDAGLVPLYLGVAPAQADEERATDGWIAAARIRGELTSVAFRDEQTARAMCVEGVPFPFARITTQEGA